MIFFVVVVEALAGYGTLKKSRKLSQYFNESRRDRQSRRLTIEKLLIDAKDMRKTKALPYAGDESHVAHAKCRAKPRRVRGRVALGGGAAGG